MRTVTPEFGGRSRWDVEARGAVGARPGSYGPPGLSPQPSPPTTSLSDTSGSTVLRPVSDLSRRSRVSWSRRTFDVATGVRVASSLGFGNGRRRRGLGGFDGPVRGGSRRVGGPGPWQGTRVLSKGVSRRPSPSSPDTEVGALPTRPPSTPHCHLVQVEVPGAQRRGGEVRAG